MSKMISHLKAALPGLTEAKRKELETLFKDIDAFSMEMAAEARVSKGDSYAIFNLNSEDDGGQYLVRWHPTKAGRAAIIHADTLVFPLPVAKTEDLEVPEEVQRELSEELVRSLAKASGITVGKDEVALHAEALRSGVSHLPLLKMPAPAAGGGGAVRSRRGLFSWVKGLFGGDEPAPAGDPELVDGEDDLNRQLLATAKAQVNVLSSKDGPDGGNLACVWAVDRIFQKAFGRRLTTTLGTAVIDEELRNGKGRRVKEADLKPGHIIISPTGTGSGHGNIGIMGEGGLIYSNSSARARWEQNHTLATWKARYVTTKKMALHFYQVLPVVAGARRANVERVTEVTRSVRASGDAAPALAAAPVGASAAEALARIDQFWRVREAEQRRSNTRRDRIKLVAEGDSWFDFKLHRDVIDWLEKDHDYEIENVAKGGACLYEMAYGPEDRGLIDFSERDPSQLEEVVRLIKEKRPQALLLSGAGNDFVGPEFIMLIHHALASPTGVNKLVSRGVFELEIEPAFRRIIETATAAARREGMGELPILMHGYDHVFPDGRAALNVIVKKVGPWMGPSFEMKGYPYRNGQDLERRRALVRHLIDAVYGMLARLSQSYPNVHVIDLRGTLPNIGDWHDELHPTRDGFRKVAGKFHEHLTEVLRNRPRMIQPARAASAGQSGNLAADMGGTPARVVEAEPEVIAAAPVAIPSQATCWQGESSEVLYARARDAENRENVRQWIDVDPLRGLAYAEALELAEVDDTVPSPLAARTRSASDDAAWTELRDFLGEELDWELASPMAATRAENRSTVPTLDQLRAEYDRLYSTCRIRPRHADTIAWYFKKIREGKPRYEVLGQDLNIPWKFIAITHSLEASNDFRKHLHNGDPLSARTVRVPAGRIPGVNPPYTFTQSAHDAMKMKDYHRQSDWSIPAMLYRWEKYNGWGYRRSSIAIPTPYLWSFSEHYSRGKFVRDGVYDPNAVSRQAGAAVLLKAIESL